jgi:hypothetical protein
MVSSRMKRIKTPAAATPRRRKTKGNLRQSRRLRREGTVGGAEENRRSSVAII